MQSTNQNVFGRKTWHSGNRRQQTVVGKLRTDDNKFGLSFQGTKPGHVASLSISLPVLDFSFACETSVQKMCLDPSSSCSRSSCCPRCGCPGMALTHFVASRWAQTSLWTKPGASKTRATQGASAEEASVEGRACGRLEGEACNAVPSL